jgi:hypothetical protein
MSQREIAAQIESVQPATRVLEPTEDAVRDYAYHLYRQSGDTPGRDVENWLKATACLKASMPEQSSTARLHPLLGSQAEDGLPFSSPAAAERELRVLRRGRAAMESGPSLAESDVRTSLFDDRP